MQIALTEEFIKLFPDASIHALVCKGLTPIASSNLERWEERALHCVKASNIRPERLSEGPEFQEWRAAYSKFGLRPSKFRSSIEQLWKRGLQGNFIRTPVKLVDLYCRVSLIARIPMGGYDLDSLTGDINIRLAHEGDAFWGIGEKQASSLPPGIVVYADKKNVVCFGWNHRDSAHTCLQPGTERAIFFADSAIQESRVRAENGLDLLREALQPTGCQFSRAVLDRNHISHEFGS